MIWDLPLAIFLWIVDGFLFIGIGFLILYIIAQILGE